MVILTVADAGPYGHIVDIGAEYLNAPSGVLTDALGRPVGSGLRKRMPKNKADDVPAPGAGAFFGNMPKTGPIPRGFVPGFDRKGRENPRGSWTDFFKTADNDKKKKKKGQKDEV